MLLYDIESLDFSVFDFFISFLNKLEYFCLGLLKRYFLIFIVLCCGICFNFFLLCLLCKYLGLGSIIIVLFLLGLKLGE